MKRTLPLALCAWIASTWITAGAAVASHQIYCYGDGTGTACPCANSGGSQHGCAHSASTFGAWLLHGGGSDSVAANSVVINVGNPPSGAPCLFFQGTAQSTGSAFGDGLLCVGGTITRLAVVFPIGSIATCPSNVATLGGVPAAGGVRTYQVWYRDSSSTFCGASTFNLSNGLEIQWTP